MSEPRPPGSQERVKVAILGGGCGGLSAAWRLTATAALRQRFEVSVYQLGWQLGGKGASGRTPHGASGAERGQRIHEHGLHIWFGFYEHAFRIMREAYEQAGLAAGEEWWRVPFEKCDSVSLYDQRVDGTWSRQAIDLPRRGGLDRGPPTDPRRPPLGRVIARTTKLLATGLRSEVGRARRRGGSAEHLSDSTVGAAASTLDQIAAEIDRVASPVAFRGEDDAAGISRGIGSLAQRPAAIVPGAVDQLIGRLREHVGDLRSELAAVEPSDRMRLWRDAVEIASATLAGIVGDGVLFHGFRVLDEEDLRDWLARHGASEQTLARSPVLRGLYDLTFSYRGGDKLRPSLAAGKGLQSLLMMVNYEGAFMWRMRAGMGDVVFAPLYIGLAQRGVDFHFFSRITGLRLAPGRPEIGAVELVREATVIAGADRYDPIKRIGDWWCWPAEPYRDQLSDCTPRVELLRRGVDFDQVVLAIPVGAQREICGELADANPRFKQMLDRAETVRTKAFQVWLTKPIDELRAGDGAQLPSANLDPPATAYAEPFDTYCDMSHLLPVEGYGDDDGPKGVAYFCAVLPDTADEAESRASVRAQALRYLEQQARTIWPGAFHDGSFDWSLLFDPLGRVGPDRIDAQYFRANVGLTDRYVTTPAGSVDSRLDPAGSGFENLVLAGDWTHNEIDGGCVEAAVISGERAAQTLIARPARVKQGARQRTPYVEYGALATAPGPLLCERARLYCFLVAADRTHVQRLCDRVLKEPTGGALRYRVPRLHPVILTVGTIAGLRSLHPAYSGHGSASEPEAAIWVPTVAQRFERGRYVDEHMAIFMPYIWVDDPIAFASGREVYGFAKTQGWMRRLDDPRETRGERDAARLPDPPDELVLDVYGAAQYGPDSEIARRRLLTITQTTRKRRGIPDAGSPSRQAQGDDIASLLGDVLLALDPAMEFDTSTSVQRSLGGLQNRIAGTKHRLTALAELLSKQHLRHVFLKQIRDAEQGDCAALQQIVEASATVTPGSLRWRRLQGPYELSVQTLASHPLEDELGLEPQQIISLAFAAEFGFRMEAGVVRWP